MLERWRDLIQHMYLRPDTTIKIVRDGDDARITSQYEETFACVSIYKGFFNGVNPTTNLKIGLNNIGLLKDLLSGAESADLTINDSAKITGLRVMSDKINHSFSFMGMHQEVESLPDAVSLDSATENPKHVCDTKSEDLDRLIKSANLYSKYVVGSDSFVMDSSSGDLVFKVGLSSAYAANGVLKADFGPGMNKRYITDYLTRSMKAITAEDSGEVYFSDLHRLILEVKSPLTTYVYVIGSADA